MKYNGIELEPITTPQVFNPPKEMLVWDIGYDSPVVREVWSIAPKEVFADYPVQGVNRIKYQCCAEIPEEPKPKRATNIQLMSLKMMFAVACKLTIVRCVVENLEDSENG